MQSSWIGWVAFFVLAGLIGITSCQAWLGEDTDNGETAEQSTSTQ